MQFVSAALRPWLRRFGPLAVTFLAAQMLLRVGLAILSGGDFIDGPLDLIRPFLVGFWFDLVVALVLLIPGTLYWALLPERLRGGRFDRAITYSGFAIFAFAIGFSMIGEVLFWNEFGARFNFIAVDYLIYTREVAGNIWESYPVGKMLAVLVAAALALTFLLRRPLRAMPDRVGYSARALVLLLLGGTAFALNDVSKSAWTEVSTNSYANELSENGSYTLVRAFFRNEIDYRRFYAVQDDRVVNNRIRELVAAPNARFVSSLPGDIARDIVLQGCRCARMW